jgi:hypothetical protein
MPAELIDLNRIVLNLARSKEFPDGSSRHGYDFIAPLGLAGTHRPAPLEKVLQLLPRSAILGRRGGRGRSSGPQAGWRRARPLGVRLQSR